MSSADDVFDRLARSAFRSKFKLGAAEHRYLQTKGMDVVLGHARDFVDTRIAPAAPRNDGKQTPMRGHPVFIAQHATATCCRGCLAKWHGIAKGSELSAAERERVVDVISRWLRSQAG